MTNEDEIVRILICPKPPNAQYVEGFHIEVCHVCKWGVVVSPSSQWLLEKGVPIYCEECAAELMLEAQEAGEEVVRLPAKYGSAE